MEGSLPNYRESLPVREGCLPIREGCLPGAYRLSAYVREDWFKLYLSDVGLLSSVYGMLVKRELLGGTLAGNIKGGLYENFVASELQRSGFPLRYYKNDSVEV